MSGIGVRERHPLKQGLKLGQNGPKLERDPGVRERHPLKQGLKHDPQGFSLHFMYVRERHPLKQGLKPWPSIGGGSALFC